MQNVEQQMPNVECRMSNTDNPSSVVGHPAADFCIPPSARPGIALRRSLAFPARPPTALYAVLRAGSAMRRGEIALGCISSRGQAMVEYVIIAGLLMASLGILTVFFVTFNEYGGRILALVSSEYP